MDQNRISVTNHPLTLLILLLLSNFVISCSACVTWLSPPNSTIKAGNGPVNFTVSFSNDFNASSFALTSTKQFVFPPNSSTVQCTQPKNSSPLHCGFYNVSLAPGIQSLSVLVNGQKLTADSLATNSMFIYTLNWI